MSEPHVETTFCLLHGGWHGPGCWEPFVPRLRSRGHEALTPDLPFHDSEAGFEQRVEPALEVLEGVEGPVAIVGHSLASGYAPLAAVERPGSLVVHLCPRLGPFTPPPGAPGAFREGVPFPADQPDGTSAWDPDVARDALYGRLPPEVAGELVEQLRPLAPARGEFPLPGHPDVPTALVYAADDELFEPAWERFMATELLEIEPIEIPGGHFPMFEDPDALAVVFDRLAREHAR